MFLSRPMRWICWNVECVCESVYEWMIEKKRKYRNNQKKHVDLLRCSSLMAMWTTGLGLKREKYAHFSLAGSRCCRRCWLQLIRLEINAIELWAVANRKTSLSWSCKKKPKWDTYFIMEQSSPLEMRRVGILWANKLSKMNWPWKLPAVKVALIKSIMKASVMLN